MYAIIWSLVGRRLSRVVPPDRLDGVLGDLREDHGHRRRTAGRLRAFIWLARETRSLTRAYRAEARASAGRTIGSVSPRSQVIGGAVTSDLRHTLRRWRRRPGFAVATISTLAVGIGATTAIFSVAIAVLLRPSPWPSAERVVAVHGVLPDRLNNPATAADWNALPLTWPGWWQLRTAPVFEDVAAWYPAEMAYGEDRTRVVNLAYASSSLLSIFGARPSSGRFFGPDEDETATNVAVISHEMWQQTFGGREDVVGQTLRTGFRTSSGFDDVTHTIVGVLPADLAPETGRPDVMLPIGLIPTEWRRYGSRYFRTVARLAPDTPLDVATAATAPLAYNSRDPENQRVRLARLIESHDAGASRAVVMLFAGAAMLLLVSCATVAGLLVGDARARRSEVAVRAALGGSRWRLLRPVLLEQMLLAAAAAVVGVGLASWALPLFVAQAPGHLPGLDAVAIDGRVVAFASALAVATMIVFGLAPAVRLVRTPTTDVLAEGGRDGAPARHRVQRLVVASQIALSLVLIVGASLMAETLLRLTSSPLGFEPRNLVVVTTQMTRTPVAPWPTSLRRYGPGEVVPSDARQLSGQLHVQGRIDHVTGLLDRLSGLPGVVAAAGAAAMPFAGRTGESLMKVDDVTEEIRARRFTVTDGYFQAMGMPVLGGRGFDRADLGQRVAVVSEEFARRFLDGRPLGRRVVSAVAGSPKHVVVGVVPDVRVREFSEEVVPAIYVPVLVAELQRFALRTAGDPGPVLTGVRDVIRAYDPQVVVSETTTMEGRLAGTLALERFRAALSSVFGGAALVLATIGLYGLATRRVADRRRELAVRAAVGAGPADLRQLVFGDGLMTLAIGLVVGVPAASAASRLMSSYVFGVSPGAPHVLAISAAVLTAAGLGAMINPARRAARTDPMLALRE